MNGKYSFILTFLFFIEKTNTSDTNSLRSTGQSQMQSENHDNILKNFLTDTMRNFSTWLSSHDPFGPMWDPVQYVEDFGIGFNVNLDIEDQLMSGHSNFTTQQIKITSSISSNQFSIKTNVYYDKYLNLEGKYTTHGSILHAGFSIPFKGKGNFSLHAIESQLTLFVNDYKITDDGYIDISSASLLYRFLMFGMERHFDDIELEQPVPNGKLGEHIKYIGDVLVRVLLSGTPLDDGVSLLKLPKLILVDYLEEVFSKNKLSAIIPGWKPYSSTSTTSNGVMSQRKLMRTPNTLHRQILDYFLIIFVVLLIK